jgi:alpha-beta hydrolase superfamily lysophospholipase
MRDGPPEQVVATDTADGIRLDGVLLRPAAGPPAPAVVWLHGFGANFAFPPYLRLGRALAAEGLAVVVGNTRGHDLGTLLAPAGGTPYWGGAAWERVDDSPHDVAAWVDFALRVGAPAAVLVGHSLGAVKATYYQALRQDPRVVGLALASPPLRSTWDTRAHPAALAEAARLVADGRPEALFAGPWGTVSAQTYLSLDRVGFDQFGVRTPAPNLGRVRCPVLALAGTEEGQVATPADLETIRRHAVAAARVGTHVVAGADHFYTGHEAEVAAVIAQWASGLA